MVTALQWEIGSSAASDAIMTCAASAQRRRTRVSGDAATTWGQRLTTTDFESVDIERVQAACAVAASSLYWPATYSISITGAVV